jgi:iron complex outermembrane receptor protein
MLNKVTFRATFIALCTMLSAGAYAIADAPRQVDIPAGELSVALLKVSKQYGADLVYRPEQVHGLKTHGAHGALTTEQAVTQLLQGTPLELRTDQSGAMLIAPSTSGSAPATSGASQASNAVPQDASDASKEGKRSSSEGFRVAQLDQGTTSPPSVVANSSSVSRDYLNKEQLTELVVTAQKREEHLQDVPVPVSVISTDALLASNQLRLQDYYTRVPGLSIAPNATAGAEVLSIRGVTTGGFTNPTVGITVDDVPYGASTYSGGNDVVPDIDPGDLARVEVLRGPQGTLYGASSLGGLLKFVTVDPSTDAITGRVQAGTSSVYNGRDLGYDVRGSVNVPLSDALAVRASGFTRQDPGYIDNVETNQRSVNREDAYGGRLAAMWRPSAAFSLKISALYEDVKTDGSSDVDKATPGYALPILGDLQQSYLRGTGGYDRKTEGYSATLSAKLGDIDLTAITGYNVTRYSDLIDITYSVGDFATRPTYGVAVTVSDDLVKTNKFTQEIRLSTPIGKRVDWLVGAFYTHEKSTAVQDILPVAPEMNIDNPLGFGGVTPTTYEEYAAFTDVTFRITDKFDVQVGGRESQIRQTSASTDTGLFVPLFVGPASPVVYPEVASKANAFTYLLTPQFKVSPDLMVYARLASGYRPGGPNNSPGVPRQYDPDRTKNYEIGAKGDFLDHKFTTDVSVYYINWKDLQLSLVDANNFGYVANGGRAKSEGVEISVEAKPLTGLTIASWISWGEAVLTASFPPGTQAVGAPGDRLPYSSRWSGNVSVEQSFPLVGNATGFVACSMSYTGDRLGEFASIYTLPPERQYLPGYAKTDLRAGAKYDTWTINLFVNNVADKRGLLQGGIGGYPPFAYTYILPRTVGLSLVKTF